MDTSLFRQLLCHEVFYFSCIALGFIIIVLWSLHALRKEYGISLLNTLVLFVTVFVLVVTLWSIKIIPILKDLDSNNYIAMHCFYERLQEQTSYVYSDVRVVSEEGEMLLYLPHKGQYTSEGDEDHYITASEAAFPVGAYEGTAWYSENSHYILKFIPDES